MDSDNCRCFEILFVWLLRFRRGVSRAFGIVKPCNPGMVDSYGVWGSRDHGVWLELRYLRVPSLGAPRPVDVWPVHEPFR